MDFAAQQGEVDLVEHAQRAEVLGDALHAHELFHLCWRRERRWSAASVCGDVSLSATSLLLLVGSIPSVIVDIRCCALTCGLTLFVAARAGSSLAVVPAGAADADTSASRHHSE